MFICQAYINVCTFFHKKYFLLTTVSNKYSVYLNKETHKPFFLPSVLIRVYTSVFFFNIHHNIFKEHLFILDHYIILYIVNILLRLA